MSFRYFGFFVLIIAVMSCSEQNQDSEGGGNAAATHLIQLREPVEQAQIHLTDEIAVPGEAPGYTLILPEGQPLGLVVLFHSGRDTTHPGFEQRLYVDAVQRQVAAMYVTTGNPFEFLFDTTRYHRYDRYIGTAVDSFDIPKDRLLFGGMSLAGTRAVKFAEWCMAGQSQYEIRPRAIAICDAPLDFLRFWRQGQRALHLQLNQTSINEAKWVNGQLEQHLGGTPDQAPEAYTAYSPYVYGMDIDPKLHLLQSVALRAYTEPDVQWWIQNRGKGYYGINAIDAAGIVNDLKLLGNQEAELITTTGKGYHPDGRRHPHSWSIIDNGELVDWLLALP